jgi:hypothetical protein
VRDLPATEARLCDHGQPKRDLSGCRFGTVRAVELAAAEQVRVLFQAAKATVQYCEAAARAASTKPLRAASGIAAHTRARAIVAHVPRRTVLPVLNECLFSALSSADAVVDILRSPDSRTDKSIGGLDYLEPNLSEAAALGILSREIPELHPYVESLS